VNSAEPPICSDIAFAAPATSLFKAAHLAVSRFIFLPTNNSADNSFSIDDSKSSILSIIPSILPISTPNAFVVATASAISFGFFPNDKVVAADTFPISFNTSFSFIATPNFLEDISA